MKTSKKRHMWTPADEKILLANRTLPVGDIRDRFFKHMSVASVNHKLGRLQQELTFNRVGQWATDELAFLAANLNLRNSEIQKTIPRPAKDLDAMRYSMKHGRSTNVRVPRRARNVEVSLIHSLQNELGSTQYAPTRRIQHISIPGLRNTAEAELKKAIKHLNAVEKLLEINELVKEVD